jgi:hypothetical protein
MAFYSVLKTSFDQLCAEYEEADLQQFDRGCSSL